MVYLPHWPTLSRTKIIKLDLKPTKELLLRLGNPQFNLPPVIHVAGTNGKGSTIAFLKSILERAGYIVHRYISPHIKNFNERIVLAGREISNQQLYQLMEEVRIKTQDIECTFFEATTAAAFLAFSRIKADVLLLETGMGGKLDSTNIIVNPLLSIITTISLDHTEYLGDTIPKIAYEKAGIIKKDSTCVVSWQPQEALRVIEDQCLALHTKSYVFGHHWNIESSVDSFKFIENESGKILELPAPSLIGIHQILNAATAVAAVKKLKDFKISNDDIKYGISNTYWPARMERIKIGKLVDMLPSGWELWVDGAHNQGGALMIAETIRAIWSDKPTFLINGRTGKRDIKGFLEPFAGIIKIVCGVKVKSEPISESAENISNEAQNLGFEAHACESIQDAIKLITKKPSLKARILVCGSLYLAADIALANKG